MAKDFDEIMQCYYNVETLEDKLKCDELQLAFVNNY